MNRELWLVVIGALGLMVGGSGCARPGGDAGSKSAADSQTTAEEPRRHTVKGFLSDTGRRKAYDSMLVASLCQLEGGTKGLDSLKRICPTGHPGDVPIPSYPPYPPQ